MSSAITYERKVRYSDTDALGHVFNVNYFVYFDDAVTDYMEVAMGGQSHAQTGYEIVLAHAECDFRASGQLGETLHTSVRVERIGTTSLTFALRVNEAQTGRLLAEGKEVFVVVNGETMRPAPVPDALRSAIETLEAQGA